MLRKFQWSAASASVTNREGYPLVFLPVRGGVEESLLSLRLGQGTALTPHCGVIHSRAQFDSPRFSFCLVAQDFSSLSMITSVFNPFTVLLFRKLSLSGTLHRMVCLSALQIPSAVCRWRDLVLTLSHILSNYLGSDQLLYMCFFFHTYPDKFYDYCLLDRIMMLRPKQGVNSSFETT